MCEKEVSDVAVEKMSISTQDLDQINSSVPVSQVLQIREETTDVNSNESTYNPTPTPKDKVHIKADYRDSERLKAHIDIDLCHVSDEPTLYGDGGFKSLGGAKLSAVHIKTQQKDQAVSVDRAETLSARKNDTENKHLAQTEIGEGQQLGDVSRGQEHVDESEIQILVKECKNESGEGQEPENISNGPILIKAQNNKGGKDQNLGNGGSYQAQSQVRVHNTETAESQTLETKWTRPVSFEAHKECGEQNLGVVTILPVKTSKTENGERQEIGGKSQVPSLVKAHMTEIDDSKILEDNYTRLAPFEVHTAENDKGPTLGDTRNLPTPCKRSRAASSQRVGNKRQGPSSDIIQRAKSADRQTLESKYTERKSFSAHSTENGNFQAMVDTKTRATSAKAVNIEIAECLQLVDGTAGPKSVLARTLEGVQGQCLGGRSNGPTLLKEEVTAIRKDQDLGSNCHGHVIKDQAEKSYLGFAAGPLVKTCKHEKVDPSSSGSGCPNQSEQPEMAENVLPPPREISADTNVLTVDKEKGQKEKEIFKDENNSNTFCKNEFMKRKISDLEPEHESLMSKRQKGKEKKSSRSGYSYDNIYLDKKFGSFSRKEVLKNNSDLDLLEGRQLSKNITRDKEQEYTQLASDHNTIMKMLNRKCKTNVESRGRKLLMQRPLHVLDVSFSGKDVTNNGEETFVPSSVQQTLEQQRLRASDGATRSVDTCQVDSNTIEHLKQSDNTSSGSDCSSCSNSSSKRSSEEYSKIPLLGIFTLTEYETTGQQASSDKPKDISTNTEKKLKEGLHGHIEAKEKKRKPVAVPKTDDIQEQEKFVLIVSSGKKEQGTLETKSAEFSREDSIIPRLDIFKTAEDEIQCKEEIPSKPNKISIKTQKRLKEKCQRSLTAKEQSQVSKTMITREATKKTQEREGIASSIPTVFLEERQQNSFETKSSEFSGENSNIPVLDIFKSTDDEMQCTKGEHNKHNETSKSTLEISKSTLEIRKTKCQRNAAKERKYKPKQLTMKDSTEKPQKLRSVAIVPTVLSREKDQKSATTKKSKEPNTTKDKPKKTKEPNTTKDKPKKTKEPNTTKDKPKKTKDLKPSPFPSEADRCISTHTNSSTVNEISTYLFRTHSSDLEIPAVINTEIEERYSMDDFTVQNTDDPEATLIYGFDGLGGKIVDSTAIDVVYLESGHVTHSETDYSNNKIKTEVNEEKTVDENIHFDKEPETMDDFNIQNTDDPEATLIYGFDGLGGKIVDSSTTDVVYLEPSYVAHSETGASNNTVKTEVNDEQTADEGLDKEKPETNRIDYTFVFQAHTAKSGEGQTLVDVRSGQTPFKTSKAASSESERVGAKRQIPSPDKTHRHALESRYTERKSFKAIIAENVNGQRLECLVDASSGATSDKEVNIDRNECNNNVNDSNLKTQEKQTVPLKRKCSCDISRNKVLKTKL